MSRLTESEWDASVEQHIFPCDCQNGDYVRIVWDSDVPDLRWLIVEHHYAPRGIRRRIATAWKLAVRGHVHHAEVVLNDRSVVSLRSFLNDKS